MDIIMKISPTEAESLCTVPTDFELIGGYWFTVSRIKIRWARADQHIYLTVRDEIIARGRICQNLLIDQEIIGSLRNVQWLWRREGQWVVMYISLFKYKKPIPHKSKKFLEYVWPWKRLRIFPHGEPEGAYTCKQAERKRFKKPLAETGTPYTKEEQKDVTNKKG